MPRRSSPANSGWNHSECSNRVAIPGDKRDISTPLRLQFQLNVRTIHPDFVGTHPLRRRRAEHLAGANLELRAMPGQETSSPSSSPSERGPPRCVQVLSMAWNLPLNRAIFFPCTSTNLPWLGSSPLACATLTYSGMLTSSIAQLS